MKTRLKPHVGMDYRNQHGTDLFCLQVLNSDDKSVASVDMECGRIVRVLVSAAIQHREPAIRRLAMIHYRNARKHPFSY